jgi:hypothetical protein
LSLIMSTTRIGISFAPALATRSGAAPSIGIPSPQCWQHTRGLRLEFAFLRPSVGNTLGGCVSNLHSFAPVLATRSGAAPHIGIHSPGVGNTLGGYASNWHSFAPALATRSGAAPRIGIPSPLRW